MKPRGIWMIIGLIVVIGIGITAYIREYTKQTYPMEQKQIMAETEAVPAGTEEIEGEPSGVAMARILPGEPVESEPAEMAAESPAKEIPADGGVPVPASVLEDTAAVVEAEEPVMARAVPAALSAEEDDAEDITAETQSSTVLERLKDLDEQIAKSQAGKSGDTTNSQKAASETERKLWEAELSKFLDVLEGQLDKDEKDALMKEQNEWIRQRENKALEASGKQNGSVRQELEYTISMTETTRSRVYELAEEYGEILSEAGN